MRKQDIELVINPYEGVGPIKLGMSMEEVRRVLKAPWEPIIQLAKGELPADDFLELGIHVYYKQPGICEAIEIYEPSNPTFQGQSLIGRPYKDLREWFLSMGSDIVYDDSGLELPSLGMSLYAPDFSEEERPDEPVEAVLVFDKPYWEKLEGVRNGTYIVEWNF